MEWEFTPEQVVKAEVDYGFEDFRQDLLQETRINLGSSDPDAIESAYNLLFDLCYWQATGRPLDAFVAQHHHSPPVCEFLRGVAPAMESNVAMLGAILQRMIMAEVESGVEWELGVGRVDAEVRRMTAMPPACGQP